MSAEPTVKACYRPTVNGGDLRFRRRQCGGKPTLNLYSARTGPGQILSFASTRSRANQLPTKIDVVVKLPGSHSDLRFDIMLRFHGGRLGEAGCRWPALRH